MGNVGRRRVHYKNEVFNQYLLVNCIFNTTNIYVGAMKSPKACLRASWNSGESRSGSIRRGWGNSASSVCMITRDSVINCDGQIQTKQAVMMVLVDRQA